MKLCNDTITVFNKRVDPNEGGNVYVPTTITGASWYATDATTVDSTKGGLVAANKVTVRIPEGANTGGKSYADPLTYASASSVEGLWTLQNGDIIIKGAVTPGEGATEDRIWSTDEGDHIVTDTGNNILLIAAWTPARLKKMFAECMTVLAVTNNRRAPNAPHWRITGT